MDSSHESFPLRLPLPYNFRLWHWLHCNQNWYFSLNHIYEVYIQTPSGSNTLTCVQSHNDLKACKWTSFDWGIADFKHSSFFTELWFCSKQIIVQPAAHSDLLHRPSLHLSFSSISLLNTDFFLIMYIYTTFLIANFCFITFFKKHQFNT